MAKLEAYGKSFRDSLKGHRVKIVGLVAAGAALATSVSAANETFDLTILSEFADALIGLAPKVGELADVAIPVVIKVAVAICICAPFVFVAMYLHKKL